MSPVCPPVSSLRGLLLCSLFSCLVPLVQPCPTPCWCFSRRAEVVCNSAPFTSFPSEALPPNTSMLTIQFTNISSISEQQLNHTPHLLELHLFSNSLQELGPHLLRGLPRLRTLDLTGNRLSVLPADVFSHAPLQSLVLKNNQIQTASGDWLAGNGTLTWLDLSGNHLTKIPTALLQKLPHLDNLDLPNNRLEHVPAGSLDALEKLERLNLHSNKLRSLDAEAFRNNLNLTHLFMSGNRLQKIPSKLFQNLTHLKHLSLDENRLQTVAPGSFDALVSLEEEGLDLSGNPWTCGEEVSYLWRWIKENKSKVFLPGMVTCAAPPALAGRSVVSLTERDIHTPTESSA